MGKGKHQRVSFKDLLENFFQQEPGSVWSQYTESTEMHKDIMLRELMGKFEIEGMPDWWDYDWFMTTLFLRGYLCITDTAMGVIPLKCGTKGINVWNRPTSVVIANHILGDLERTIDVDCVVIRLQYNFQGIERMRSVYSSLLATADGSIAVGLMNTRATFVAEADDEAQAKSWKYMYQKVSEGEPAVVVRKGMNPSNFYYLNPKQSFVADLVQDVYEKIHGRWLHNIGIRHEVSKKQRVQSAEQDAMNDECEFDILHWVHTIEEGLDKANKMFGLNLKLKVNENTPPEGMEMTEKTGEQEQEGSSDA